ncbi:MAG: hypothetical protein H6Q72_940 [Firmicutes bacterium]|nr:hypothetical protein [Bacillota bacterium]
MRRGYQCKIKPSKTDLKRMKRWERKQETKAQFVGQTCCDKAMITTYGSAVVVACPDHKAQVIRE